MDEDESRKFAIVTVEDSTDARLFIDLSSHAADLTEANSAVDLALQLEQDDQLPDVKPFLIGSAVVSYCRSFMHSNVRTLLSDHIDIPSELSRTHEVIKTFRNQTIAHSQSELAVTFPVGILDANTREFHFVSAVTVTSTLPDSIIADFAGLIRTLLDLLEEVIAPVRGRLEQVLRTADRESLVAAPPQAIHKLADDFRPRSKRARYPAAYTLYWDRQR